MHVVKGEGGGKGHACGRGGEAEGREGPGPRAPRRCPRRLPPPVACMHRAPAASPIPRMHAPPALTPGEREGSGMETGRGGSVGGRSERWRGGGVRTAGGLCGFIEGLSLPASSLSTRLIMVGPWAQEAQ